ncbi:gustatory receptor family protein 3-like [Haliotis cracherodii]|uniref:gustatory receptor family protein 3-like n=1 Tax=Haliotis cracherodii TaxID=6455 RepID=UPI0039EBBDD3
MKIENIAISEGKDTGKFITIEERMKPLLLSMKLLGLYFDPPQDSNVVDQSQNGRKKISTRLLSFFSHRLYCYIVLLLLWFNFVQCAVSIFPVNESLPLRIILTSWYLQCSLNATIMVVSCQRLSHLRSFYKHWDSLFKNNVTNGTGFGFICPRKYLKFATSGGWALFFVNIAAFLTILFGNVSTSTALLGDIVRPFPKEQWTVLLDVIMLVLDKGAWMFPVIFVVVVSNVIKYQFLKFGHVLSKQIQEADDHIPDRLPELRSRYTQLCQAVDIINRTFKWILGLSFLLLVLLACFISYQMINGPQEKFTFIVYSFWLGSCFVIIILLTRSSSEVHDAAHSLLEDIFHIGTKGATSELLGQLNLFVSKLTGTSTGFTAINFFVITNEFLLTLGGLFITYFFLLLQFKI